MELHLYLLENTIAHLGLAWNKHEIYSFAQAVKMIVHSESTYNMVGLKRKM